MVCAHRARYRMRVLLVEQVKAVVRRAQSHFDQQLPVSARARTALREHLCTISEQVQDVCLQWEALGRARVAQAWDGVPWFLWHPCPQPSRIRQINTFISMLSTALHTIMVTILFMVYMLRITEPFIIAILARVESPSPSATLACLACIHTATGRCMDGMPLLLYACLHPVYLKMVVR